MGKGLQKLSRAQCGKLPVVIPEGRLRPVAPLLLQNLQLSATLQLGTMCLCLNIGRTTRVNLASSNSLLENLV